MFKLTLKLKHPSKILLIGYSLIFLAILIGFITRIISVFQYVSFDIGPDSDQVRDAFAVINIWKGELPTLGPQVTTIGSHHILPLYYYLFFPFTLLGADPVFQALPNALFSFLSIPLLIYLVYQLLENIQPQVRILFSGLAGFWYSVLYGEIFISNFQWNPSSIPFFLLAFTLLYSLQIESSYSFFVQVFLWITYGLVLAILISLHTTTLVIIPIVFIISSAIFIYKAIKRKRHQSIILPFVSVVSCVTALIPYWIGEFGRDFRNTKSIIKTLVGLRSSNEDSLLISLGKRVSNTFINYYKVLQEAYFWNPSWICLMISVVFMSLITYLGISKFKGNKYIWFIWCSTWGLYLYAASNVDTQQLVFHNRLLILFTPIILTVTTLAYINLHKRIKLICYVCIGLIISISCFTNLFYDYQFMLIKYGANRLMNTSDLIQIMSQLPSNTVICDPRVRNRRKTNNQYNYIDTNITHKNIQVVNVCSPGNYVIHPKRLLLIEGNFLNDTNYEKPYYFKFAPSDLGRLWPIFKTAENGTITRPSKLISETDVARVYLLN